MESARRGALVEREPGRFYRRYEGNEAALVYTITGSKPVCAGGG